MNGSIRFRYPVLPGGDLTALAAQLPTYVGQNTRVDGNPAVITDAVLQFDPLSGHAIEFEVELTSMPPELTEQAERYLSTEPPVVSWEPPSPSRRPQGTFATADEALAYARGLPPAFHVLDEHGETVPCDHPACDHCRGRETPWHYSSVCRVEGHDFPTVPRDGEGTDTCTRCGVEVTRGGGREVYRYPGGDG